METAPTKSPWEEVPETARCTVESVCHGPMAALSLYHVLVGPMAALEASTMDRAG